MKKILITVFRGTSSEALFQGTDYDILVLPSNREEDKRLLIQTITSQLNPDYILSFGQKPLIKDRITIERQASLEGKTFETTFDVPRLCENFQKHGIPARESQNPGTSFCNSIYWNGLNYLATKEKENLFMFLFSKI